MVNSSEIELVTYCWIHSYVIVHRKDLGTVGPAKSMRWWIRTLKQIWSWNDWLPSLLLSLPLPCKAFSFEKLRCGHRAYLFSTSSNFLLTAELQHNYICKCSIFFPPLTLYMWERKIRLQSTARDGAAVEEVLQMATEEEKYSSCRTRLMGDFRTSVTQSQQENIDLANFKQEQIVGWLVITTYFDTY